MNSNLRNSIDRAINLMHTPSKYEKYISIKISPIPRQCCCFRCWPNTWAQINKYISPRGPIEDEGDILIGKNNNMFVLECHESGPEIIIFLGLNLASNIIAKYITDLIGAFIKFLGGKHRQERAPTKLRFTKRRQIKGVIEEEEILEVDLNSIDSSIMKNIEKKLNTKIKSFIKNL